MDLLGLGRKVAARICPRGPWHDDVAAAAALSAWLHPDQAERAAWSGGIDELRRLTHWDRRAAAAPQHVELDDNIDAGRCDIYADDDPLDGLTAESRWIVERVADGFPRQDVARVLGVTPSMVSKRMRQIARTVGDGR